MDSRKAAEVSGAWWGKTNDSLLKTPSLERRVLRWGVLTKCTFWDAESSLTCMRKNPYILHTYCEGDEARTWRLTVTIFHCTSPQGERSSTAAVAEAQQINILNNHNRRANMAASWRQRNLSRWRFRQYKTTTWECRGQHPRHQPMNWCDSIQVSDNRHTQGCSQSILAYKALSEPMKEINQIIFIQTETDLHMFQWMILQYVDFNLLNKFGVVLVLWI